ncbi:TrmH family RNA methyltransferase [Patescibacteria group bacterium]|nr:TrmH family RNA methyltransferase [Patescibacteria group bacterium]
MKSILILENIRSAQNVGSLFRTADSCGIQELYLIGITPTPIDKYGRPNTSVTKTALGAELTIAWKQYPTSTAVIKKLKKEGYTIIAIEQSKDSVDYKKVKITTPVAFVLGNEVEGLSKRVLEKMDIIAEIPMKGEKESLNVSVAGGIAMFRILNV